MSDKERPDFVKLADELETAEKRYEDAAQAESFARNRTTDAKNALNQAQKAFDKACGLVRDGAPRDSDWAREKSRKPRLVSEG